MTPEEQKNKCENCKYADMLCADTIFKFIGCTFKPYKGKWVAEIEKCPKEFKGEQIMNYMKQVAEILGVELGEEFKLTGPYENLTFKLTKDGGLFYRDSYKSKKWEESFILQDLLMGEFEILKPILDKQEKKYLENVIRPFKDKVIYICKYINAKGNERIMIQMKNNVISFPEFEKGTMYKGMEVDKEYSLKELGLFEDE